MRAGKCRNNLRRNIREKKNRGGIIDRGYDLCFYFHLFTSQNNEIRDFVHGTPWNSMKIFLLEFLQNFYEIQKYGSKKFQVKIP
jgi:hypothetical protein